MTNPVLNQNIINNERTLAAEPMTISGAINKTFILFALLVASSLVVWDFFAKGFMDKVNMLMMAGLVVSIIAFLVIMFKRSAVAIAAPIYAVAEGLLIGGISAQFEKAYPGIAIQAISMTFMALGSLLFLYKIGAIKCTEKFRSVILISTVSVAGIYLISILGSFFGLQIPGIFGSGLVGIGFSLLVVVIAALNLIIDFDFIERGAQGLLDKSYEWYGAFGLMVTLIWLYLEILNLLSKLRER